MRFSKAIILSAVAAVLPFASQAAPINGSTNLSIDGLNFSGFTCSTTSQGTAVPDGCGSIKVNTITQPGTGIEFNSGFVALAGDGHYSFSDAVLGYNVSSSGPISNVGLDFNGYFDGYAIASVTETVFDNGNQVGFLKVACGTGGPCVQTDNIALNGSYSNLFIQKDIEVAAFCGYSGLSYVDQTFDGPATPEPASFAMLGTGLLGAAGLLRRRAKISAKKAITA